MRPLPAPSLGEAIEFQLQAADGSIDVQLGRLDRKLSLRRGSSVTLSPAGTTIETTALLSVPRGEFFFLSASVRPGFTVTDIQALSNSNELAYYEQTKDRLNIRLAKPITPNNPIKLQIDSRGPATPEGDYAIRNLLVIEFDDAKPTSDHMALRTFEPYQLSKKPSETGELAFVSDSDLVVVRPGDLAVALDGSDARISMRRESASYNASCSVTGTIVDTELHESIRITCNSIEGSLRRIVVHLTEEQDSLPDWVFADDPSTKPVARRLGTSEQEAFGVAGGQTWEFSFSPTTNVKILGKRVITNNTPYLSLASTIGATSQEGSAALYNDTSENFEPVASMGLAPSPEVEFPNAPKQRGELVAFYTYSPDDCIAAVSDHRLTYKRRNTEHLKQAWVWLRQQHTTMTRDGATTHQLTYRIENHTAEDFKLSLPRGMQLQRLSIDNIDVPFETIGNQVTVPLPSEQRFIVLQCNLSNRRAPLSWQATITPSSPEINFPILDSQYTFTFPREYRANHARLESTLSTRTSWPIRLFGKYSRFWARPTASQPLPDNAAEFGGTLALAYEELSSVTPPRWGDLLNATETKRSTDRINAPLSVDVDALAAIGIDGSTLVREKASQTSGGFLDDHGLAVCATQDRLLLTTQTRVALLGEHAQPRQNQIYQLSKSAPDCVQLMSNSRSVSDWQTSLETLMQAAGKWNQSPVGWGFGERVLAAEKLAKTISIYDAKAFASIGWLALASVVLIGSMLTNRRWLIVVIGGLGIACLMCPVPFLAVLRGALWGCVILGLGAWFFRDDKMSRLASATQSTIVRSTPVVGVLLILFCNHVPEQTTVAETKILASEKNTFPVLIRVDEEQQPSDDYVYLPIDFYNRLLEIEARQQQLPFDWWIRSISYQTELPDLDNFITSTVSLDADLEIEVVRRDAAVTLPWDRHTVKAVSINGRSLSLGDPTSDSLPVTWRATEIGPHALSVNLTAEIDHQPNGNHVTFDLPRNPQAKIHFDNSGDRDKESINVSTAFGPHSDEEEIIVAELGPTSKLDIIWNYAEQDTNIISANRMSLLVVRPEAVSLDVRLDVDSGTEQLSQIEFVIPDSLTWVSAEVNGSTIGLQRETDGQRNRLLIDEPIVGEGEVHLRFLLNESSGVGSIKLPDIEMPGLDVRTHTMGLSVDQELQFQSPPGSGVLEIGAEEFAARWSRSDDELNAAFDLTKDARNLVIRTFFRKLQFDVREFNELAYDNKQVNLRYEAKIIPVSGIRFSYRFHVPHDVDIRSVRIHLPNREFEPRWFRDDASLQILLSESSQEEHEISILGTTEVGSSVHDAFEIHCVDCRKAQRTLIVKRRPNIVVEQIDGSRQKPEIDADDFVFRPIINIARPDDTPVRLRIVPNEPKIIGQQHTSIRQTETNWQTTISLNWAVPSGVVDQLRLGVPADWSEQDLRLDPPLPYTILTTNNRHELVVWLLEPSIKSLQIMHPISAADKITVPRVIPFGWESVDHIVELPKFLATSDTANWNLQGLTPANELENSREYRATGDFVSELTANPNNRKTVVGLRDVVYSMNSTSGTATFYIAPHGADSVLMNVPQGVELISILAFGNPLAAKPLNDDSWTIPLASRDLAHRLQVIFRSEKPGTIVKAPTLSDDSETATIWTIDDGIGDCPQSRSVADSARQSAARLRAIKNLLENPTSTSDYSADVLAAWQDDWTATAIAHARHVEHHVNVWPDSEQPEIQDTITNVQSIVGDVSGTGRQHFVPGAEPIHGKYSSARFATTEGNNSPPLLRIQKQPDWSIRFVGLAILLTCAGTWWLTADEFRIQKTLPYRTFALITIGVLWYLMIHPGWLGALLALMSTFAWAFFSMQARISTGN